MDRYWEGRYGSVADLDVVGPTHPLVEYAAYSTDELIRAFIVGREPWQMSLPTGE